MGLLKVGNQYLHLARYLFDTCSQQRQRKLAFFIRTKLRSVVIRASEAARAKIDHRRRFQREPF
jgi:hypothetical protein